MSVWNKELNASLQVLMGLNNLSDELGFFFFALHSLSSNKVQHSF